MNKLFVLLALLLVAEARSRDEIVRNVRYLDAVRIADDLEREYKLPFPYAREKIFVLGEQPRGAVQASLDEMPLGKYRNESFTDYCISVPAGINFSTIMYKSLRVIVLSDKEDIPYCGNIQLNSDGGATTFGPNCEVIPPPIFSQPFGNLSKHEAYKILQDFIDQHGLAGSIVTLAGSPASLVAESFAAVPLLEHEDFRKYSIRIWSGYDAGLPRVYKGARVLYGAADGPNLCTKSVCAELGPLCEILCPPIPQYISYRKALDILPNFANEFSGCFSSFKFFPLATAPRQKLLDNLRRFPYSSAENLWGYLLAVDWKSCEDGPYVYKDMRIIYFKDEFGYNDQAFCFELTCTGPGPTLEPNNVTITNGYYQCSDNVCPPQPRGPNRYESYRESRSESESEENHVFAYASIVAVSLAILVLFVYRLNRKPHNLSVPKNTTSIGPQQAAPSHNYAPVPQYYPSFPRSIPATPPYYYVPVPQFYPPFPRSQPASAPIRHDDESLSTR